MEERDCDFRVNVKIMVELCHPDAQVPTYATEGDAGMDIYATEDCDIKGMETRLISTGLKVAIPKGYELQIRPRSGLSLRTNLRVANSPGTIDSGYRDEIKVILQNTSPREPRRLIGSGHASYMNIAHVKKGERIAQLVLSRVPVAEFVVVDDITAVGGDRGGGFGHTGK